MKKHITSRVIAEVVKDKKGNVIAQKEFLHRIDFNNGKIKCNTQEIIKADKEVIIPNKAVREIEENVRKKIWKFDLTTGEIE